jgi:hypothetical protein
MVEARKIQEKDPLFFIDSRYVFSLLVTPLL